MTADELAEAEAALRLPSPPPHLGLDATSPEERSDYRARFRAVLTRLAPFAEGSPSGLDMTWDHPERREALARVLRYLVLDDFPALLADDEHLEAPELVTAYRAAAARIFRRAIASSDVTERLAVLGQRSSYDEALRLDPFERLDLRDEVSTALGASDVETQQAAIDRLCAFEAPPTDDATVDRLRAFLDAETDRFGLAARCANWTLSRIATDRAVAVLLDQVFTESRSNQDAQCALDRVVEARHAPLVASAYARANPGYVSPHVTFVNVAAPFLARLELTHLVRDDLASDDGDRVYRGIHWAARLPPRQGRPLLRTFLTRTDIPDPGGHHDWGNAEGLRNSAGYGLEWLDMVEPSWARRPDRCWNWACTVPTYGLTPSSSCASRPE